MVLVWAVHLKLQAHIIELIEFELIKVNDRMPPSVAPAIVIGFGMSKWAFIYKWIYNHTNPYYIYILFNIMLYHIVAW